MTELKTVMDLFRHMEWADAVVWSAALASGDSRSDEKLRAKLHHLHLVQHAFLRVWRNEPLETPFPEFKDLTSLVLWVRHYYAELFPYIESLSVERLSAPMPMPWAGRVVKRLGRSPGITTVGETILQVALHSQYHRGQVNAQIRTIGAEPPLVDYIAWIWLGRPAASWP